MTDESSNETFVIESVEVVSVEEVAEEKAPEVASVAEEAVAPAEEQSKMSMDEFTDKMNNHFQALQGSMLGIKAGVQALLDNISAKQAEISQLLEHINSLPKLPVEEEVAPVAEVVAEQG